MKLQSDKQKKLQTIKTDEITASQRCKQMKLQTDRQIDEITDRETYSKADR